MSTELATLKAAVAQQAADVTTLKKQGNPSAAVASLEQDMIVLKSQLENRPAPSQGASTAEFDVFRSEPEYDLRLKDLPNLYMMPHMGTATVETRDAMGHRALDNVAEVFAGRQARDAL